MKPERRFNWMVSKEMQLGFSRRLLVYWCGTWLAIFAVPICARLLVTKLPFSELASELVADMWFPMMMSLLVLPIIFWDSIRFSHRIAGPVCRINRNIKRLVDGESAEQVTLRENDFCQELANDFNRLVSKFQTSSDSVESEHQEINV